MTEMISLGRCCPRKNISILEFFLTKMFLSLCTVMRDRDTHIKWHNTPLCLLSIFHEDSHGCVLLVHPQKSHSRQGGGTSSSRVVTPCSAFNALPASSSSRCRSSLLAPAGCDGAGSASTSSTTARGRLRHHLPRLPKSALKSSSVAPPALCPAQISVPNNFRMRFVCRHAPSCPSVTDAHCWR